MRKTNERLGQIGDYWLSKRPGSEAWHRTWFDNRSRQTRRASVGTSDLQEAKLALAAWVTTHGRVDTQQRADTVALEAVLVRYYDQHAQHLPSADQAKFALAKWSDHFAGVLVSEITIDAQRKFVSALRRKGLSDGYIRRILSVGQAALNRAHREGEIASVPHVSLALAPEAEPRERILSLDEARALFAAASAPHQIMYLLLAFATAARPQAILDLTAFQIDCDARLIRLNPVGRAQNKKRRPTLPICETLLPWLRGLPAGPVVQYRGKRLTRTKMMFDHLTGRIARVIRREAAGRAATHRHAGRRAEAWAAVDDGKGRSAAVREITAYTIRHTVAVELRKRGVPVWEVAGFLGHSSGYRTTERYAKFGPDHLASAVRAIDAYFADLGVAGLRVRSSCVAVDRRENG